jgi:hypothetical protein
LNPQHHSRHYPLSSDALAALEEVLKLCAYHFGKLVELFQRLSSSFLLAFGQLS